MKIKLNKVLKFISRSFGFLLINFAISLIFLIFFANLTLQQTDVLKNDVENYALTKANVTQEQFNQFKVLCQQNLSQEGCDAINDNSIDNAFSQITPYKKYLPGAIFLFSAALLLGFVFVFFGTNNLLEAFYKISLNLTIQSFLASFYYSFLPDIIKYLANSGYLTNLSQNLPKEELNSALNILLNWLNKPLAKTFNLVVTIGIIFLVITVILFFIKRKDLKVVDKGSII